MYDEPMIEWLLNKAKERQNLFQPSEGEVVQQDDRPFDIEKTVLTIP